MIEVTQLPAGRRYGRAMPGATSSQAILALCRCTPIEWILLIAALALLIGLRIWRRRDRTVHGLPLAVQLAAAYVASVVFIGVGIWLHERDSSGAHESGTSAPLEQQALAARANSICAAEQAGILREAKAPTNHPIADVLQLFRQEARDIGRLRPAPDVARDWHALVADIAAEANSMAGNSDAQPPSRRIRRRGGAAAHRLGVHCDLLDT